MFILTHPPQSMDPPWPNLSAQRSQMYNCIDLYDLFKLPIKEILDKDSTCVIAVWITNRPRILKFMMEKLFPSWNAQLLAKIHWLKVARSGEPVVPLSSTHRSPHETILLAKVDRSFKVCILIVMHLDSEPTGEFI